MKYQFVLDPHITQHGWLSVLDNDGNVLATREEWSIINDWNMQRMEKHECKPGQMIPSGDPRWYTHCQWCGESIVGQRTAYDAGQWHFPTCRYQHHNER